MSSARRVVWTVLLAPALGACPNLLQGPVVNDAGVVPAHLVAPAPLPAVRLQGGALPTSPVCARCHSASDRSSAMRDIAGRSVAPFDLWRASLMANAARDPIYFAQLAAETKHAPAAAEAIETTCLSCHSPLLYRQREGTDSPALRFRELFDNTGDASLALDGVSCAVCHRIAPDNLGTQASFDGNYTLGPDDTIYGPYSDPFAHPMQMHTGFTPTEGAHLREAGVCGTCHTLTTHALRPDGTPTGAAFDEQVTYLEWRASSSAVNGLTCQSCHMPARDEDGAAITTAIAHRPEGTDFADLPLRSPYGRHVFVGGNTLALQLLRDEPMLGADAPPEAFDAAIAEVGRLLERAAAVEIGLPRVEGQELVVPVTARTLAGHKLPSGYPSRRLVLHVRVLDDTGAVILESGAMDADGRLLDAEGAPLPGETLDGAFLPHIDVVTGADTVQVWEEVPGDEHGVPTTLLLGSNVLLKDNRLLPPGFNPTSADGVRAGAKLFADDDDFDDDGDTVDVRVPSGAGGSRPARIEVELLYQTLSPRWREGLAAADTPWGDALEEMLQRADLSPKVLARTERSL